MATFARGISFGATETITNTKLHNLVDLATLSAIVNADIDASAAIVDTKLADITTGGKVRGISFLNLPSIPSGAGVFPIANVPIFSLVSIPASAYPYQSIGVSLASIPNTAFLPITLASWVDGSSLRNISSIPNGLLNYARLVSSLASGGTPSFDGSNNFVGRNIQAKGLLYLSKLLSGALQFDLFGQSLATGGTRMPHSGSFRNLYVDGHAGGVIGINVAVMINAVKTALEATGTTPNPSGSDVSNSAAFVQGDYVRFNASVVTGSPSNTPYTISMEELIN